MIKPKSIKLLSVGLFTISLKAIQKTCFEITPLSNNSPTKDGYPSPIAAGFAVIPKMADIAPFVAAVPSYLLSPELWTLKKGKLIAQ